MRRPFRACIVGDYAADCPVCESSKVTDILHLHIIKNVLVGLVKFPCSRNFIRFITYPKQTTDLMWMLQERICGKKRHFSKDVAPSCFHAQVFLKSDSIYFSTLL